MKEVAPKLLLVLLFIFISGCVSKKSYSELEKRVSDLELSSVYLKNKPVLDSTDEDSDEKLDIEDKKDEDIEAFEPEPHKITRSSYVGAPEVPDIDALNFPEFVYPPPHYSKIENYPLHDFFSNPNSYGDVDSELKQILMNSGFADEGNNILFNYFQIKMNAKFKGYAVVTPFEKIDHDGKPLADRFNLDVNKKKDRSFLEYIFPTKLNKGYFRFFAFLITDDYYGNGEERMSKAESLDVFEDGSNVLHPQIISRTLTPNVKLHVLVYEFEQLESQKDGKPIKMKSLSVEDHLKEAGIWQNFKK